VVEKVQTFLWDRCGDAPVLKLLHDHFIVSLAVAFVVLLLLSVIASAAKQSMQPHERWIASSLRSASHAGQVRPRLFFVLHRGQPRQFERLERSLPGLSLTALYRPSVPCESDVFLTSNRYISLSPCAFFADPAVSCCKHVVDRGFPS